MSAVAALPHYDTGSATIQLVSTGEQVPVTIIKNNHPSGEFSFNAYDESGQNIGSVDCDWYRTKENGIYGSYDCPRVVRYDPNFKYGQDLEQANHLVIQTIDSYARNFYRGVGTVLVQAAIEYGYSLGCEGRVQLEAVRNSHCFYYKLGMRTGWEEIDEQIEKLAQTLKNREVPKDFRAQRMHMPQEGIKMWRERISANPIFQLTALKI
ncbi:MAG: hypothetical protein V4492_07145 [Chlamydiota bacterium]